MLMGHLKMGSILYGTTVNDRSAQFRCRFLLQGYFLVLLDEVIDEKKAKVHIQCGLCTLNKKVCFSKLEL